MTNIQDWIGVVLFNNFCFYFFSLLWRATASVWSIHQGRFRSNVTTKRLVSMQTKYVNTICFHKTFMDSYVSQSVCVCVCFEINEEK